MSRLQEIEKQMHGMESMLEISSVFEGIASMKVARIKNQVLQATLFFNPGNFHTGNTFKDTAYLKH